MSTISELVDSNEKALQRLKELIEYASARGNNELAWDLTKRALRLTTEKHKELARETAA